MRGHRDACGRALHVEGACLGVEGGIDGVPADGLGGSFAVAPGHPCGGGKRGRDSLGGGDDAVVEHRTHCRERGDGHVGRRLEAGRRGDAAGDVKRPGLRVGAGRYRVPADDLLRGCAVAPGDFDAGGELRGDAGRGGDVHGLRRDGRCGGCRGLHGDLAAHTLAGGAHLAACGERAGVLVERGIDGIPGHSLVGDVAVAPGDACGSGQGGGGLRGCGHAGGLLDGRCGGGAHDDAHADIGRGVRSSLTGAGRGAHGAMHAELSARAHLVGSLVHGIPGNGTRARAVVAPGDFDLTGKCRGRAGGRGDVGDGGHAGDGEVGGSHGYLHANSGIAGRGNRACDGEDTGLVIAGGIDCIPRDALLRGAAVLPGHLHSFGQLGRDACQGGYAGELAYALHAGFYDAHRKRHGLIGAFHRARERDVAGEVPGTLAVLREAEQGLPLNRLVGDVAVAPGGLHGCGKRGLMADEGGDGFGVLKRRDGCGGHGNMRHRIACRALDRARHVERAARTRAVLRGIHGVPGYVHRARGVIGHGGAHRFGQLGCGAAGRGDVDVFKRDDRGGGLCLDGDVHRRCEACVAHGAAHLEAAAVGIERRVNIVPGHSLLRGVALAPIDGDGRGQLGRHAGLGLNGFGGFAACGPGCHIVGVGGQGHLHASVYQGVSCGVLRIHDAVHRGVGGFFSSKGVPGHKTSRFERGAGVLKRHAGHIWRADLLRGDREVNRGKGLRSVRSAYADGGRAAAHGAHEAVAVDRDDRLVAARPGELLRRSVGATLGAREVEAQLERLSGCEGAVPILGSGDTCRKACRLGVDLGDARAVRLHRGRVAGGIGELAGQIGVPVGGNERAEPDIGVIVADKRGIVAEVAFGNARVAVQITLVGVLLGIPELESRGGVGCLGEVLGQNGGVGASNKGAVGVQHGAASVGARVRETVRGLDRAGLGQLLKAGTPGEGRARYGDAALVIYEALRGGLGTNLVDARKKRLGLRGVKGAGYAQCEARFACGGRRSAGDCRERRGALRTCVGGVLTVLLGVAGGRAVTGRGVAVSWGDVGV